MNSNSNTSTFQYYSLAYIITKYMLNMECKQCNAHGSASAKQVVLIKNSKSECENEDITGNTRINMKGRVVLT